MLRFARLIGPGVDTALTRYLTLPVIPTVMGYDGRLQFTHEDDALAVLRRCTLETVPGTYNIAGDGVLMLAQAIARLGRVKAPIPAPLMLAAQEIGGRFGLVDFSSDLVEYLKYGRAMDTTRMRTHLGFEPKFRTVDAFQSFADHHRHPNALSEYSR